ncbi:MAG: ATP-binding cassette domain-containing protein [Prolixibacteraceae bacterium]
MIQFQNVSLKLGDRQILDQFNLTVSTGEKVVLTAPSGSGKTSLLKLILGFIDADQGMIRFGDKEVKSGNMQLIRSQIGYLSQDIDFPNGRVAEVFPEIFSYYANRHIPYSTRLLANKLREVNLPIGTLQKNTSDISGGERQRLGWILIMLLDRPVLLLDEPTSALDEKQKEFFIRYVVNTDKTVICASHDPEWQLPGIRIIPGFPAEDDLLHNRMLA